MARKPKAGPEKQLRIPDTPPKAKAFHVLLPLETRRRIEALDAWFKREIGFIPSWTNAVKHLLKRALDEIEAAEGERPDHPARSPRAD